MRSKDQRVKGLSSGRGKDKFFQRYDQVKIRGFLGFLFKKRKMSERLASTLLDDENKTPGGEHFLDPPGVELPAWF
jgi:hypothetical protein